MAFILKLPTLAAYGGYNIDSMDDETIKETYFGKSYRTGYMCQATNGGMQL